MKTTHPCHARGCDREIALELLMCGRHWALVPEDLRRRVWKAHRERDTEAHIVAKREAVEAVALAERGTGKEPEQGLLFGGAA